MCLPGAPTAAATASGPASTRSGSARSAPGQPIYAVSAERLLTVVPALASRVERLMLACWHLGIPLRVTQARRTQGEQDALYAQGRTAPGPIVTWTRDSKHVRGRAVDFAWKTPTGVAWDGPWQLLGLMAGELGLISGVHWQRQDKPHIELPDAVGDED